MPIKIPNDLPARAVIEHEGVMVLPEDAAARQDIRPLRIGLLNLMPTKIKTETQIARLVGATPLQVELTLVRISDHVPRNTPAEHMAAFYRPWADVAHEKFDGFIITGAPIELLAFEEVSYWEELKQIFDWTQSHVHSTLAVCWGAQAALNYFHGVPKHALAEKAFGVFRHRNLNPSSPYLRGFSDDFSIPVSRWTEVRRQDLPPAAGLEVLMESDQTGLCFIHDPRHRYLYIFNHIEYDTGTLGEEYWRDADQGKQIAVPQNYYPDNDPRRKPENRWRSHAHLLFANWINEVYQTTPFEPASIGALAAETERNPVLVR